MKVLGLFFTRGVSLESWVESGLFDREVAIYRRHLFGGTFDKIVWFTYGVKDELLAASLHRESKLPDEIVVIGPPRWLKYLRRSASICYSMILPLMQIRAVILCDVLKTNQMDGSAAVVVVAKILGKPLYVRTGYTLSRIVSSIYPRNPIRNVAAWITENLAFRYADKTSVSSQFDFNYVLNRYRRVSRPPEIIGNFVDTERFVPGVPHQGNRLIYVGRLSPEKNLRSTIAACTKAGVGLDILGQGEQEQELRKTAETLDADVRWLGVVANDALPAVLYRYRYFVLASLWEGMPKALLEAMSAGLVCIGNDTTGINEVINDGVTGYLSPSASQDDIAETIRRALAGDSERVAFAAMRFVRSTFSLDTVVAQEREVFTSICRKVG
ncbi:MAG: glycosyltransferase family 4 protein [Burkholderiales bacterium]|nr:glycosyltransferase family 4 protein [Burkholderiales bacterium]